MSECLMGKTAGGAGIHLGSLLYAHILRRASRSATHEADDDARCFVVLLLLLDWHCRKRNQLFFLGEFRAIFDAAVALAVFKE